MTKVSAGYFFDFHRPFQRWAGLSGRAPRPIGTDTVEPLPTKENDLAWLSLSTPSGQVIDPAEELSCLAMLPLLTDKEDSPLALRRWM